MALSRTDAYNFCQTPKVVSQPWHMYPYCLTSIPNTMQNFPWISFPKSFLFPHNFLYLIDSLTKNLFPPNLIQYFQPFIGKILVPSYQLLAVLVCIYTVDKMEPLHQACFPLYFSYCRIRHFPMLKCWKLQNTSYIKQTKLHTLFEVTKIGLTLVEKQKS